MGVNNKRKKEGRLPFNFSLEAVEVCQVLSLVPGIDRSLLDRTTSVGGKIYLLVSLCLGALEARTDTTDKH